MARVRRKFNDEFKQDAVRRVTVGGTSMTQAACDLMNQVDLLRTHRASVVSHRYVT